MLSKCKNGSCKRPTDKFTTHRSNFPDQGAHHWQHWFVTGPMNDEAYPPGRIPSLWGRGICSLFIRSGEVYTAATRATLLDIVVFARLVFWMLCRRASSSSCCTKTKPNSPGHGRCQSCAGDIIRSQSCDHGAAPRYRGPTHTHALDELRVSLSRRSGRFNRRFMANIN